MEYAEDIDADDVDDIDDVDEDIDVLGCGDWDEKETCDI